MLGPPSAVVETPPPFSKVSVTLDEPIRVPSELSNGEFETLRLQTGILLRNEAD